MDKWQLINSLNEIEADYITEYESLSSFVASKKMIRKRNIRIATRIAACVAIVTTGAFLTIHDINKGLIGSPKSEETRDWAYGGSYPIAVEDDKSMDSDVVSGSHGFAGNITPGNAVKSSVMPESVVCDVPTSEVTVEAVDAGTTYLTLRYNVHNNKSKWYSNWNGYEIYSISGDEQILYGSNVVNTCIRVDYDDQESFSYTFNWLGLSKELAAGRYMIITHLNDGNINYDVRTVVVVE